MVSWLQQDMFRSFMFVYILFLPGNCRPFWSKYILYFFHMTDSSGWLGQGGLGLAQRHWGTEVCGRDYVNRISVDSY
jgi:hypothetical protein